MELKKYLKENKLRLDTEEPDDDRIWKEVNQRIRKENQGNKNWFWKVAAVFLLGVLITYVTIKETEKEKVVIISLADVSKELGEKEAALKLVADKKWAEIGQLSPEDKTQFQFLLDELKELDKVYGEYEKDLNELGGNDQIINALLDYYEKKIRILNRLSLEIQKQKNHEDNVTI
jgi:hypothetical protein